MRASHWPARPASLQQERRDQHHHTGRNLYRELHALAVLQRQLEHGRAPFNAGGPANVKLAICIAPCQALVTRWSGPARNVGKDYPFGDMRRSRHLLSRSGFRVCTRTHVTGRVPTTERASRHAPEGANPRMELHQLVTRSCPPDSDASQSFNVDSH